jgi:hypothetical protein
MKGSFFQSNSIKFTVETPNIKKKLEENFKILNGLKRN